MADILPTPQSVGSALQTVGELLSNLGEMISEEHNLLGPTTATSTVRAAQVDLLGIMRQLRVVEFDWFEENLSDQTEAEVTA